MTVEKPFDPFSFRPRHIGPSPEEVHNMLRVVQAPTLDALVDEAHALRRKTAAHAHGATGAKRAIRAGIDSIVRASHVELIDQTPIVPMRVASINGKAVSDILAEVENQLRSVRLQAAKAEPSILPPAGSRPIRIMWATVASLRQWRIRQCAEGSRQTAPARPCCGIFSEDFKLHFGNSASDA
jgi:hypothetical protein